GDGVVDSPEQCDQGSAVNGTPGACCASNCQFKTNGTACTGGDGTSQCSNADTRNGASAGGQSNDLASGAPRPDTTPGDCKVAACNGTGTCNQNFANQPVNTSCTGNGTSECSGADTCNASGVCLNNDVAAGGTCTDTTPGDCKKAGCDGSGSCN